MSLRLQRPGDAILRKAPVTLSLLTEAAQALGGRLEIDETFGFVGRFCDASGKCRPIFGKSFGLNSDASAALAADKDYTARWLSADGLPAPDGVLVFSERYRQRLALKNRALAERLPQVASALHFADRSGFPVVAKPNCGSEGDGVRRAQSADELAGDLTDLLAQHDRVRIEAFVTGRDYRLLVLNGAVVLGYERRPLSVTGDGDTPLCRLLDIALTDLAHRHRGAKLTAGDARIARTLAGQNLTFDTVPDCGRQVVLLSNANLSTGGSLVELTEKLPKATCDLAVRAAEALGLRWAGVDILAPDLLTGPDGATVLEVNSAPGLDYFASESEGHRARVRDILVRILSHLP